MRFIQHRFSYLLILTALGFCAATAWGQAPSVGKCGVLPSNNVWNTPIDQLPLSNSSASWVSNIGLGSPLHPAFGSDPGNGIPFIKVTGTQIKYGATFYYADESDAGPYAIPLNAPIEGGSSSSGDRHAIAIDTDNCILYELFEAYPQWARWNAVSGAIFNLGSNSLRPAWWTSADAAGLPIFPGLVRYEEVAAGAINHAIRFTVPHTQFSFIWPGRHRASTITDPAYPPMGARFRLKASFDISGFSPANQVILRALKKYGMIVADNGSPWFITGVPNQHWDDHDLHYLTTILGSNFEAVDESSLMVDPNSGQAAQAGVNVTVSPSAATVTIGSSQQFSATVINSSDTTVSWSVNGVPGGNSTYGKISAGGVYTSPGIMPSNPSVVIEAASNTTPSAFATATVTLARRPITRP